MKISLITCYTPDYLIGANNKLPWHLPADLARFRKITSGHIIVMGRKTYQSIGRPLPNRSNVVFSHNRFNAQGCYLISSIEELETLVSDRECFVIGGAQIYRLFIPYANRIYSTLVKTQTLSGDTYFPASLLNSEDWCIVESTDYLADDKNKYDLCFRYLERIKPV